MYFMSWSVSLTTIEIVKLCVLVSSMQRAHCGIVGHRNFNENFVWHAFSGFILFMQEI